MSIKYNRIACSLLLVLIVVVVVLICRKHFPLNDNKSWRQHDVEAHNFNFRPLPDSSVVNTNLSNKILFQVANEKGQIARIDERNIFSFISRDSNLIWEFDAGPSLGGLHPTRIEASGAGLPENIVLIHTDVKKMTGLRSDYGGLYINITNKTFYLRFD